MNKQDPYNWKLKSEEIIFDTYRKIAKRVYEMPDGKTHDWYVVLDAESANTFALTEENQVIIFKQFRPGPQKVMFELPGGHVDPGETPIDAVRRELEEETGYVTKNLHPLVSIHKDAYSSGTWHGFIAQHCTLDGTPKHEASEFGEVVLLSIEEFKEVLKKGQVTDIATGYAGLDYINAL